MSPEVIECYSMMNQLMKMKYQSRTCHLRAGSSSGLIQNGSVSSTSGLVALIQTPRLPIVRNVPLPAPFVFQVLVFERGCSCEFVLDQLDFEKLLQEVNFLASFF